MDTAIEIPGTRVTLGLDSIAGLIPVVGDVATALVALYIIREAQEMGAPKQLVYRMLANVGIDAAVGAIPVLGDVFDVGFKANQRNLKMLEKYLDVERRVTGS